MISELYSSFKESSGITTDSRKVHKNAMFIALSGPTFNGNEFALNALEQGARYAVVDDASFAMDERFILVDDGLKALQQLAIHHRDEFHVPVIAITGSNGKTTTKELIAAVLQTRFRIHYTKGNFNNHIGLPLTILNAPLDIDIMVLEMGANHIGEIAELCTIGKPTHGLITNIGRAHLEGFGSIQGVLQAKTELYNYIHQHSGTVFLNDDDALLTEQADKIKDVVRYGSHSKCRISGKILESDPILTLEISNKDQSISMASKLVGDYNFSNILAAAVIGDYFDIELDQSAKAITNYVPENNRSQIVSKYGSKIILDAYNANPSSMEQAIENITALDGSKIVILGDMMELGSYQQVEHRKIIDLTLRKDFDRVILVGEYFKDAALDKDPVILLNNAEEAATYLADQKSPVDWILIKGSRKMKLEQIANE